MQKALYRFLLFSGCLLFVSCSGILDDVSKKNNSIVCSLDFSSLKAARVAATGTEGTYTVDLIMRDVTTGAAIQEQTVSAETTAVITFDSVAVGTSVGFSGTLSYNDSVCGAITSSVYTIAEGENPVAITISRLYSVTFDANGGTGTMSSQTFTAGVAQELTASAFTRSGFVFVGWAAESDAPKATYTDGQSVTMTADTTLYAVWSDTYSGDFVSTHFTSDKVFDVQRRIDSTNKKITVSSAKEPYSAVTAKQITWSSGQYIIFAAVTDTGDFSEILYNSDGTQSAVLSTGGTIKYIGDYGFLYISTAHQYGTYVFTQKAITELGKTPDTSTSVTYPYTLESVTTLSQLQNF